MAESARSPIAGRRRCGRRWRSASSAAILLLFGFVSGRHAGPGRRHHRRQPVAGVRPDLAGPAHRGVAQGARPAHPGLVTGSQPVDKGRIEQAVREILEAIGEDPDREGLVRTPERVADMYEEIFAGLTADPAEQPGRHLRRRPRRDDHGQGHPALLGLRAPPGPRSWAGPTWPTSRTPTGASPACPSWPAWSTPTPAAPRCRSGSPSQIADEIDEKLAPRGVLVVIEAEHLCMSMRGRPEARHDHGHLRRARPVPGQGRHPGRGHGVHPRHPIDFHSDEDDRRRGPPPSRSPPSSLGDAPSVRTVSDEVWEGDYHVVPAPHPWHG